MQLQLGASRFAEGDYMRPRPISPPCSVTRTAPEVKSAAQYNLALCHRMLGEPDKAAEMLEAYRAALRRMSAAPKWRTSSAFIHEDAGRFQGSSAEYMRALESRMPGATLVSFVIDWTLPREAG